MNKLLIINQYFPPDRAATGILLGQLVESLQNRFDVSLITGQPNYNPENISVDHRFKKIKLWRIPLLPFSRKYMPVRLLNYIIFTLGSFLISLLQSKPDVIMCWTDPPWISGIVMVLKKIKKSKSLVVCQDVYPEILVAAKKLHSHIAIMCLQKIFSCFVQDADRVVVIGSEMIPVLESKKVNRSRIICIENWQDPNLIYKTTGELFRNKMSIETGQFVVMHSGNMGYSQNLDILIEAARHLNKNNPSILFVLIGDGVYKKTLVAMADRYELSNVRFFPYQSEAMLSESLSAADFHFVSLRESFVGLVVPSKFYSALLVQRPILAVLSPMTSHAQIIQKLELGYLCDPNPETLANLIFQASNDKTRLSQIETNIANYVASQDGKNKSLDAYTHTIESLC